MIKIFKRETYETRFKVHVADPYICHAELPSGTGLRFGANNIEEVKLFLNDLDIDMSQIQYE